MFCIVAPFYLVDDADKVLISKLICQTLDKKLENLLPLILYHYKLLLSVPFNQIVVSYEGRCEKVTKSDLVLINSAVTNADLYYTAPTK